jgi:uracil-DNA glycosylase
MNNNEEFFHSLETQIIACHRCPRLVEWRQEVARVKRRAYLDWEYWGKPVPGFGDYQARVLVVGLAGIFSTRPSTGLDSPANLMLLSEGTA